MNQRVISSATIDELAKLILDYDLKDAIELPPRIEQDTNYDNNLASNYRPQDIKVVKDVLARAYLDIDDMDALDAQLRWNYRNAGTLVRVTYGLIAAALIDLRGHVQRDSSIAASTVSPDLPSQFSRESTTAIRRITRLTVATGAHECKIPLRDLSKEYAELTDMCNMSGTDVYDVEVDKMNTVLLDLTSTTPIDKSQPRPDLARKLCLQTVLAISEYRQDDTFGRLRGFLNNVCHFANYARILTTGPQGHYDMNRLCMDVLDQVHSTDRLLNSNCVAAQGLITRIKAGELVYDRILELGRHQHRVMALEVASCIGMFSYLMRQCQKLVHSDGDLRLTLERLMKFSGIATRYVSEIQNKQS